MNTHRKLSQNSKSHARLQGLEYGHSRNTYIMEQIYIKPEYLKFGLTRGMEKYFKTCLKRSRGMQLEVTLRFGTIDTGDYYMYQQALIGLGEFGTEETQYWFDGIDWRNCPSIEQYDELWEDFFASLAGTEEQSMSRWRALYLAFPDDNILATSFFRALDNVAPQLRELAINLLQGLSNSLAQLSFGNLDSLERLTLEDEITPRDFSRCKSIRILELVRI